MSGWNLDNGQCYNKCQTEDEFWQIINNVLSSKTNKTTSYKYCFFKSILDNVFNIDENLTLSYKTIFERFTEIYWNLIVKYKLSQIQKTSRFEKSSVEITFEKILNNHNIDTNIVFEALQEQIKTKLIIQITNDCSKYVVGAFYEDTNKSFYSFDKKAQSIIFQKNIIEYFVKFKNILCKLNYFEWIKFLEKTNKSSNVIALAEKLDNSSKRGNLSFYKDFLIKLYGNSSCFYCNRKLAPKNIEMDHFIPWSYLKDDKVWNMVISCRTCNNNKKDKLPDKIYINKIISQNEDIQCNNMFSIVKYEFCGYNADKIEKIYNSAIYNGFDNGWKPKGE